MNLLYFDCFAGISGDMAVGVLLDLGAPLDYLRSELLKLALPDTSYALSVRRAERHKYAALKFNVAVCDNHNHRNYADIDMMIDRKSTRLNSSH